MSDEVSRHLDDLDDHLDAVADDEADDLRGAVAAYRDEETEDDHEGFVQHLREAALRFETSHPEISNAIARVVDSLTAAGI